MRKNNIFNLIPDAIAEELITPVIQHENILIERVVSKGHTSPASGWYDQDKNEWIMLVKGSAVISFENSEDVKLESGDYMDISAHVKHKVSWTHPDIETVWLTVFY